MVKMLDSIRAKLCTVRRKVSKLVYLDILLHLDIPCCHHLLSYSHLVT